MLDTPRNAENIQIVLINDQATPYAFVIDLLTSVFSKSEVEAKQIASTAHHYGEADCGSWPAAVAEALTEEARHRISDEGHPLAIAHIKAGGRSVPGQDHCSFCGKPSTQVAVLYKQNDAFICSDCILVASSHLSGKIKTVRFKHANEILDWYFVGTSVADLVTSARSYPERMRADLQTAIDTSLKPQAVRLLGIKQRYRYEALKFADLLSEGQEAVALTPVEYADVDVGDDEPVRCIAKGLYLLEKDGVRHAALVSQVENHEGGNQIRIEIAVASGETGSALVDWYFSSIESTIREAKSYRGKVLSLELANRWSGMAGGILVHRLPEVTRDEVVLPGNTLRLLDRNVLDFAQHRKSLMALGQSAKKGLLFYGPPGTGKTHTVRYLASCLPGHTTLLVTAEQVGILSEYFSLARLLQPSLLVIEDVDLIARQRETMGGACEESLLNRLLNEMDGLTEDAAVFFILTTNRPEQIESALAGRPGRIDQALEFPLPDDEGRQKLVRLYGGGLKLSKQVLAEAVQRTQDVSASFIKELMRRAAQAAFDRKDPKTLTTADIEQAIGEMLFEGGRLNAVLLGGPAARQEDT